MTNDVKIFAKTIEQEATEQIEKLSHHPVSDGSKVRIMPDVHAGAGCTIGTTMTIHDRVCPNLVGVDIGCGMLAVKLGRVRLDLDELDKAIRWNVPAGFCTHNYPKEWFDLSGLKCVGIDNSRALLSIGTLGGGNHFIEVDRDKSGGLWLVIHTGSRKLGLEVANWHQHRAMEAMTKPTSEEISRVVAEYKAAGRQKEIAGALAELRKQHSDFGAPDLAYLTGELMDDYLNDMDIIQRYAEANRKAIAKAILKAMHIVPQEQFTTVHNYIDHESMILRKGAVSAKKGERLIIPMNMRDGSLICVGKGNDDWNQSAPHGAGRLMSRSKARESISIGAYRESMRNVHSSCISYDTIDEAPFAYKDMKEIMGCIEFIEQQTGEKFDWDAFYKGMENYNEVTRFHLDLWEINRTDHPQVTGPTPWLYRMYTYHLHGGMDQRVDLVPAAVAGGQDHVGMSRQIVQHLQHLGLQAAVLLQVHDGLFRHAHALVGGEGHALAGVHDLVPQGGHRGHPHQLCAYGHGGVHRLQIDAAHGVVQGDAAEHPAAAVAHILFGDIG